VSVSPSQKAQLTHHRRQCSTTDPAQGKEIGDNDSFQFNAGFTAQLFRVKINTIQMKESPEENKKTNDQVMQDRQYQVGPPF